MNILRRLTVIVVAAAVTVAVAWRLHRNAEIAVLWQTAAVQAQTAGVASPNAVAVAPVPAIPISKNAQVAAPSIAPVPASGPPPIPHTGNFQPRADLNGTVNDILGVLQSGDIAALFTNFMPPTELERMRSAGRDPEEMIQALQQEPRLQEKLQSVVSTLRQIQGTAPTYNEAGDIATFTLDPPPESGPRQMRFRKVDGLWYPNF